MYTPSSIVSTLTVVVTTLSVNRMNVMVGNVYTKFHSGDTNGCSCSAKCKQAKIVVGNIYTKFYIVSTLTVVVATLSVNKMKMRRMSRMSRDFARSKLKIVCFSCLIKYYSQVS